MPYGKGGRAGGSPPQSFILNGDMRVNQTHSLANQNFTVQTLLGADQQILDNLPDGFGIRFTSAVNTNGLDTAVLFDHPLLGNRGLSLGLRRNAALGGGSDYIFAFCSIEGTDFFNLADQDATLKFWCKSTNAGTFPIILFSGTGGLQVLSANNFLTNYTIDAGGAWQEVSIPLSFPITGLTYPQTYNVDRMLSIAFPVFVGANLRVADTLAGAWVNSPGLTGYARASDSNAFQNANDVWQITNASLQLGDGGDFPNTSFTDELNKARRRYWQTFPYGSIPAAGAGTAGDPIRYVAQLAGAQASGAYVRHPVQMRDRPIVTFFSMTGAGTAWFNFAGAPSGNAALGDPAAPSGRDSLICLNPQVAGDNVGDLIGLHASFDARI